MKKMRLQVQVMIEALLNLQQAKGELCFFVLFLVISHKMKYNEFHKERIFLS